MQGEIDPKLDELDRLLNDPDVPAQPARLWALLAEVSFRDLPALARANGASDNPLIRP